MFCLSDHRDFHKRTKSAILALLPALYSIYFQFPSLLATYDVSEHEISCQWVEDNYIPRLQT